MVGMISTPPGIEALRAIRRRQLQKSDTFAPGGRDRGAAV
jgi:hypothetical protein